VSAHPGDPADAPTRDGWHCGSPKKSGGTCRNRAGKGTQHVGYGHCRNHGGNTPGGKTMAQREQGYAAVRTYGLPLDDGNPDDILLAEVRRSAGIVAWLEQQIAALPAGDVIRGTRLVRKVETSAGAFPGTTTTSEAGPQEHLWSQLFARERRHLADVCAKAIQAGIWHQHVELAEEQGQIAGRLLVAVLSELGVDAGSPRAREVIGRHFTLLSGGAS
jgi:hypothetical protein